MTEQTIKASQYHYLIDSYRSQKLDYDTKVMILKCIGTENLADIDPKKNNIRNTIKLLTTHYKEDL